MKDKYFIDTNIFVYTFDLRNKNKRNIAHDLIRKALSSQKGCISYQVVQEFLNVSLKKFEKPLTLQDCQYYLNTVLDPLCEVYAGIGLFMNALDISDRWKYSFYDSLIISAALSSKCRILYSEDLHHQQKIQDLEIINPFII